MDKAAAADDAAAARSRRARHERRRRLPRRRTTRSPATASASSGSAWAGCSSFLLAAEPARQDQGGRRRSTDSRRATWSPTGRSCKPSVRGHMAENDDFFGPDAARALEAKLQGMGKDVHVHGPPRHRARVHGPAQRAGHARRGARGRDLARRRRVPARTAGLIAALQRLLEERLRVAARRVDRRADLGVATRCGTGRAPGTSACRARSCRTAPTRLRPRPPRAGATEALAAQRLGDPQVVDRAYPPHVKPSMPAISSPSSRRKHDSDRPSR